AQLAAAVAVATAEAAAARHAATAQQRAAENARTLERSLSLLLATVPPAAVPAGGRTGGRARGTEPPDAPAALRDALDAQRAAEQAERRAREEAREGDRALREAEAIVERARADSDRAALALAEVDAQLAATRDGEQRDQPALDAEGAAARLAELDRRAERARALDDAAREAEAALAGASARRDERARDCERAGAALLQRRAEFTTATAQEAAAARALLAARDRCPDATEDGGSPPASARLDALIDALERESQQAAQALGAAHARLDRARTEVEEAARTRQQAAQLERSGAIARALEQDLHGDRFIAYIQREALQLLAADASQRLRQLSNGRYRLVIEDRDNEFAVVDGLNGDEQRSVKTLSGGETFLASLALSLALSERLPELAGTGGAVSLESLFLDEGFGSLDAESLEVAIDGLEALAGGQRMVGVISHVPQLAERLADRIEVERGDLTSRIRG
ncbi:MAG: hypothetical protein EXR65_05565, partial [Dehalococcoidia bacterium]|nr:hypothetical protein [Dehalococcoidia bacterium]